MARPILLAVDDDISVLEAVVQDLRRQYGATYRIMRAASGPAALDTLAQLKTRDEPVALIISDQRMAKRAACNCLRSRCAADALDRTGIASGMLAPDAA